MTPTEVLLSAKKDIPFYFLNDYVDNLKADGDFSLAGTEESMLSSAISYYAANGNPNKVVSQAVTIAETESTEEIDFPSEFSSVIQIRDANLQSVPYEINTDDSKIVVNVGPSYLSPYKIRYKYKLEDYFAYSVDGSGNVTIDTDTDIDQVTVADLIKRLLKTKLEKYNNKISEMSKSVQMELPTSETQGEKALAEEEIKANVRAMPSLMSI